MWKKKVNKFHNKCPFAESVFLFALGSVMGFFVNIFTSEISEKASNKNWRWIDSGFFWISVALLIVGIIYYIYFSSVSIGKSIKRQLDNEQRLRDEGEKLKTEFVREAKRIIAQESLDHKTMRVYEMKKEVVSNTLSTVSHNYDREG